MEHGTAPCEFTLPTGVYRVVVGDANAFAECSRTLIAPGAYEVTPQLVATGIAQAGMVPVAAGTAIVGQSDPGAIVYAQTTIAHPAFLIDVREVTCAEYHAYCVQAQAPFPGKWNGSYDPAWADLPVVGVSVDQARGYAEWRGKRLPSWTEWQIGARGRTGSAFPWGSDAGRLAELTTIGRGEKTPWHDGVVAVGTTALDTTWCGAFDMLGNVDEWTDSPYVAQLDGVPFPVLAWRLRGGSAWTEDPSPHCQLDTISPGPPEWFNSGFRCAKSASP